MEALRPFKGGKAKDEVFDDSVEHTISRFHIKLFQQTQTEPINVYKLLQITPEDSPQTGKWVYRDIISKKMPLHKRKQIALASQIFMRKEVYNNGQNPVNDTHVYKFKEDIFHYVTTCDFIKLVKALLEQPNLLNSKDQNGNSLLYLGAQAGFYEVCRYLLGKGINQNMTNNKGSTALHVASFYGHSKIVDLLLVNGGDYEIINNFNNKPYDEGKDDKIKRMIENHRRLHKNDPILKFISKLRKQNCINLVHKVYTPNGEYIGLFGSIKYEKNEQNKLKDYLKNKNNYTRAYHGTRIESADKIIQNGFIRPSKRGGVRPGHISLNATVNGIKNWADAMFTSVSLYMACNKCYAESIDVDSPVEGLTLDKTQVVLQEDQKEKYKFVFQVAIKTNPKSYTAHKHTLGSGYEFQSDEPDMLEWRVQEESNIVILGFYFIRAKILDTIKSHEDMRNFCDEEGRMAGIMGSKDNTLGQKVDFKRLCLVGHILKHSDQEIECDVCGQLAKNQNTQLYYCNKCEFGRCQKCQQQNILV